MTARRLLTATLTVFFLSCSSSTSEPCVSPNAADIFDSGVPVVSPTGAPQPAQPLQRVPIADEDADVTLRVFASDPIPGTTCAGDAGPQPNHVSAEAVSVEVDSPTNQPVPSSAVFNGRPQELSATVTFHAGQAGTYHVTATFTPGGGVQQTDVVVAHDRTNIAPIALPYPCASVVQLKYGTLICDGNVIVTNDGGTVRFDDAGIGFAKDDVLWNVTPDGIHRFVEAADGGLELSPPLTFAVLDTPRTAVPRTDALTLIGEHAVVRVDALAPYEDAPQTNWNTLTPNTLPAAYAAGSTVWRSAGTEPVHGVAFQLCAFDTVPDGGVDHMYETLSIERCTTPEISGVVIAADDDGVYSDDESTHTLTRFASNAPLTITRVATIAIPTALTTGYLPPGGVPSRVVLLPSQPQSPLVDVYVADSRVTSGITFSHYRLRIGSSPGEIHASDTVLYSTVEAIPLP